MKEWSFSLNFCYVFCVADSAGKADYHITAFTTK